MKKLKTILNIAYRKKHIIFIVALFAVILIWALILWPLGNSEYDGTDFKAPVFGVRNENGKLNINTATVAELTFLSGIGESKAKAIVLYRQENGDFTDIEQIKNVRGIGDKIYNEIKDKIEV